MASTAIQKHPFHLVDPSPWPFVASLSVFTTTVGGVMYMHGYMYGGSIPSFGFFGPLQALSLMMEGTCSQVCDAAREHVEDPAVSISFSSLSLSLSLSFSHALTHTHIHTPCATCDHPAEQRGLHPAALCHVQRQR